MVLLVLMKNIFDSNKISQFINIHTIQQSIMVLLINQKEIRFKDLRPKNIDTNIFSYHLKVLISKDLIIKSNSSYSLSQLGLKYISDLTKYEFLQPAIIISFVIQNSDGDVLLIRRQAQPYIDCWTLPYGYIDAHETTMRGSANRIISELFSYSDQTLRHSGDAYVRVTGTDDQLITSTFTHVFRLEKDDINMRDELMWIQPHRILDIKLAPGALSIMTRCFFNDEHFFEEFDESTILT
jgi:ADP-ribose pyrophosphatase YjhB (NUDIX family)